jgi:hypothetical protein
MQPLVFAAPPAPDISDASVNSFSSYDENTGIFTYSYSVSRGQGNEGSVVGIDLDIKTVLNVHRSNPLPNHPEANKLLLDIVRKSGIKVVPVEQESRPGWARMGMSVDGYTGWTAGKKSHLKSGETAEGFRLTSQFPPGIRQMQIVPAIHEYGLYADADAPDEEKRQMREFVESLNKNVYVLGPVGTTLGSYEHWNKIRDDLNKSIELGWIQDATLAAILKGQLASAREALDAGDGTLAKSRLQTMIEQITNSVDSQRRVEAHDLILLNSQSLINNTADTPIPYEPKLIITPSVSKLPIGVRHTITAKVINVAYNDEPVPNVYLYFSVSEGPNRGTWDEIITDENGKAIFSYVGIVVGTDKIIVEEAGGA